MTSGATVLRATPGQAVWWRLHADDAENPHDIRMTLRLTGPLAAGALEQALDRLVGRHESLRTAFQLYDGRLVQRVEPAAAGLLRVDLRETRAGEVETVLAAAARERFDLERAPLVRALLLRLAGDEVGLMLRVFHGVFDGWSSALLLRELESLLASAAGRGPALPLPPATQFRELSEWQVHWRRHEPLRRQFDYWRRHLDGFRGRVELPLTGERGAHAELTVASHQAVLPALSWAAVLGVARSVRTSPVAVVLAALCLALAGQSDQREVVLGAVYGNRRRPWAQSIVGLVANRVLLRADLSGNPTLRELVGRVWRLWARAIANGELPFEELAAHFGLAPAAPGGPPAYEVMVNVVDGLRAPGPAGAGERPAGVPEMRPWHLSLPGGRTIRSWDGFLMVVTLRASAAGGLEARFDSIAELLDAAVVARLADDVNAVLASLPELLDVPVARVLHTGRGRALPPHEPHSSSRRRSHDA